MHTRASAPRSQTDITNALGKLASYVYDSFGDLVTVTDPLGNQIVNSYDVRGNKLSAKDPDLGLWTYSYDALGELLTQTDAKGQTTSFANPDGSAGYDLLGRPTGRAASDQSDGWTYDTAPHGVGMIASASGSNAGYGRTYTYDSLSRPTKVTITASGKSYTWNRTYNSDGRLDTLVYPYGLTVKYVYTQLGFLYQLKDNGSGAVLWTANARDAELHLSDQSAGNGLDTIAVYDPKTGLVQQIIDMNARLYDPNIARFLSADTTVPDPYDGQSYNRYTYVDNRPLSFTDPTGHLPGEPEDCGDGGGAVCIVLVYRPEKSSGPSHGTYSANDISL